MEILKIDKSFILGLNNNASDIAIVRAVIEMIHSLNYIVVSEGVEDEYVLKKLQSLDNDQVQGYFLCKPLSVKNIDLWLLNTSRHIGHANS